MISTIHSSVFTNLSSCNGIIRYLLVNTFFVGVNSSVFTILPLAGGLPLFSVSAPLLLTILPGVVRVAGTIFFPVIWILLFPSLPGLLPGLFSKIFCRGFPVYLQLSGNAAVN